jgi:hypothetical protein
MKTTLLYSVADMTFQNSGGPEQRYRMLWGLFEQRRNREPLSQYSICSD